MKISIKLRVFSDRLFVSSHGRPGGGYTGGLMGRGVGMGNSGVGGQHRGRGGGAIGGGGQQGGGCRQPLRTALHTISMEKQMEKILIYQHVSSFAFCFQKANLKNNLCNPNCCDKLIK